MLRLKNLKVTNECHPILKNSNPDQLVTETTVSKTRAQFSYSFTNVTNRSNADLNQRDLLICYGEIPTKT